MGGEPRRKPIPWPLAPPLICLVLIALGLWFRLHLYDEPSSLTWDEPHFVNNARRYLRRFADRNDHPPLGKLLIALSIHLGGDEAAVFRLPSLLAGVATVGLGAAIARHLFAIPRVAWFAGAALAIDGFLIAFSKTALVDGVLVALSLASFLAALVARRAWTMVLAAVLAGLAASIKISGVVAILPILYFSLDKKKPWWLLSLAAFPLVFYAQAAAGLALSRRPADLASVVDAQLALVERHRALTTWEHPFTSHWYEWLVPTRTIPMLEEEAAHGLVRVRNSMGHPLLWWTTSLLSLAVTARLLFYGARAELGTPSEPSHSFAAHRRPAALLALMWWANLSPWVLSVRDSYVYHYLPSYTFGLLLTAGLLAWTSHRWPRVATAALLAVLAVALFYAPLWAQFPLDPTTVNHRLLLEGWR